MSEFVIDLDHIWKIYPIQKDRPGFKEFFVNFHKFIGKRGKQPNHFPALKGVSLRIQKGECVGIIGRNGAGKSTLLSIILGTTVPTKGSITIGDWVTPLLELGGGFHLDHVRNQENPQHLWPIRLSV